MPSTPANYFHLLRLHALGARKRPLVVFTPKSMLRLRAATSMPEDFTTGAFQPRDRRARRPTRRRSAGSSCAAARSTTT